MAQNQRRIFWILGTLFLAGIVVAIFLPSYLLNLIQNPDGSYLSALLRKHQLKNPTAHTLEFYSEYIPAVFNRLMMGAAAIVAVAFGLSFWARQQLREFWFHTSTPLNLAVLRIVVLYQIFTDQNGVLAVLAKTGAESLNILPGYGWTKPIMPTILAIMIPAAYANKIFAFAALVGFLTPISLPFTAFLSFWLMLLPQFLGKIYHYHHVWLALAILAFSPSGDALSIDSLVKKMRGMKIVDPNARHLKYGRPLMFMWTMIAAVYFFPGFWKFVVSGSEWFLTDNIQLKILAKVYETGREPVLPLYKYPLLCKLGGFATMAFEMLFPIAIIFPATRLLFAFSGIGFHEINRFTMQIPFDSMKTLYVCFVDWSRLIRLGKKSTPVPVLDKIPRHKTVAGITITAGLVITGFLNIDSWPFAVYPTFAAREQSFVNSIEMVVKEPGNEVRSVFLQSDPAIIRAYLERTRLRSHLTFILLEMNEAKRQQMLLDLVSPWKEQNSVSLHTEFEFWQIEVSLLDLSGIPKRHKKIGQLKM